MSSGALVALAALAVLAGLVAGSGPSSAAEVASPAAAEQPRRQPAGVEQPTDRAVFNDPTGGPAAQYAIRDHVLGMVERSQPGSTISLNLYNITDHERGFADAVLAAAERGVRVRVVLESTKADTGSARALVDGLGTDRSADSWAVVCTTGCHGDKHNHNKFYLFSQVDRVAPVVVQSSANLTVMNAENFWNNAVTLVDNQSLYDAYLDYFEDLARDVSDPDYYTTARAGNVKAYFFPRATGTGSDTVYNTLGNVECAADGGTRLRIAMWYFGRQAVAERLAELGSAGCRIDIVHSELTDGPRAVLTGAPNVRLRALDGDDLVVHSKYLLIDGSYAGQQRRTVFTGSPNYSNSALHRNDEAMLRIYDDAIHDAYVANFDRVWASAS